MAKGRKKKAKKTAKSASKSRGRSRSPRGNAGRSPSSSTSGRGRRTPAPAVVPPAEGILPTPVKPPADPNEYQLIQLKNGIRALLIHTPHASSATKKKTRPGMGVILRQVAEAMPHRIGNDNWEDRLSLRTPQNVGFGSGLPSEAKGSGHLFHKFTLSSLHGYGKSFGIGGLMGVSFCHPPSSHGKDDGGGDGSSGDWTWTSVALTVNVGSSSDPKDFQGMAHFVEHMVHLGDKKHKEETRYFHLAHAAGQFNAFTQPMTTTYHATVKDRYRDEFLDLFSTMLKDPLFSEDAIKREVNSVDNEFYLRQEASEMGALTLISHANMEEGHPLRVFNCGTLETLLPQGQNGVKRLKEAVEKFHKDYYVGRAMTLAISSTSSLAQLQKLVTKHFGGIEKGPASHNGRHNGIRREGMAEVSTKLKEPFRHGKFIGEIVIMKGKTLCGDIVLTFCLPPEAWQDCKRKPMEFMMALMSGEWEHGLNKTLIDQQLITKMEVFCQDYDHYRNEYSTQLEVGIRMTPASKENDVRSILETRVHPILKEFFLALGRMRRMEVGQKRALWKELKATTKAHYNYGSMPKPSDLVVTTSRAMQIFPEADLFQQTLYDEEYDDGVINKYLKMLTPKKMNVAVIVSPQDYDGFNPGENVSRSREKHTGTEYMKLPIPKMQELEDALVQEQKDATIQIQRNSFVHYEDGAPEMDGTAHRDVMKYQAPNMHVQHHRSIKEPGSCYASCSVCLLSTVTYNNPDMILKMELLRLCWKQRTHSLFSSVRRAEVSMKIGQFPGSPDILLLRLADAFPRTIAAIVKEMMLGLMKIRENPVSEQLFRAVKSELIHRVHAELGSPLYLASSSLVELTTLGMPSSRQSEEFLTQLDYDDFTNFTTHYLNHIFLVGNLYGNAGDQHFQELLEVLNSVGIPPTPTFYTNTSLSRSPDRTYIPVVGNCIRMKSLNAVQKNSLILNMYQVGESAGAANPAAFHFLKKYMESPFFTIIRTQEQLGYSVQLVANTVRKSPHIYGMVVGKASKFSLCHLDERIDNFFMQFKHNYLDKLTEDEFEDLRETWEVSERLTLDSLKYWFDTTIAAHFAAVKEEDGSTKYTWVPSPDFPKMNKLSIQVLGRDLEDCHCGSQEDTACGKSEWTRPPEEAGQPVHFAMDAESDFFIHHIKEARDRFF